MNTLLTVDFLKNELDITLDKANSDKIFKNYYRITNDNIARINKYLLNDEEIEEYIATGHTKRMWAVNCQITDAEERKRLYLLAQGRQLQYDMENSRLALHTVDEHNLVCMESLVILKLLGLEQKVRY